MEKIYNKLVRDNLPNIIMGNNEKSITRILSNEEYEEVLQTTTTKERIEELADMLEIIFTLTKLEDKTLEDVIEVAKTKRLKRGGFDKRIFLEKVINAK